MSSLITAFSGTPDIKTVDNVKSGAIQGQIDSSLSGLSALNAAGKNALADFTKNYTANNAAAGAETANEVGSVNRYYNGDVENALAGMRAQRKSAVLNAAKLAQDRALAGIHGNMLTSPAGGSSYDSRLGMNSFADIASGAALDNANQTSQDYRTLLAGQAANLGKSNSLLDANAQRSLVPYQAQSQIFGNGLSALGQIQGMNNNNNMYGLKQDRNQAADIVGALGSTANQLASAYTAFSGMGGGGGGGGGTEDFGGTGAPLQAYGAASGASGGGGDMSL